MVAVMKFFDEVAREGGEANLEEELKASPLANLFDKASVFTVWRPTSDEAIKNMMKGVATGKGLDIKGKSAKRGNISSYVPFIQIYEESHKVSAGRPASTLNICAWQLVPDVGCYCVGAGSRCGA